MTVSSDIDFKNVFSVTHRSGVQHCIYRCACATRTGEKDKEGDQVAPKV